MHLLRLGQFWAAVICVLCLPSFGWSAQFYLPVGQVKWPQENFGDPVTVTYSYSNLLDGNLGGNLNETQIRDVVNRSLDLWAQVSPIRFVEVPDSGPDPSNYNYPAIDNQGNRYPDIRIGHREIFSSSIIAISYPPLSQTNGLYGDLHLDTTRNWALNPSDGFDLLYVITHELGHTLGLDHENAVPAIMNSSYQNRFSGPGTEFLYPDDIHGIQTLYGMPSQAGDFDSDGIADASDLALVLSHWGESTQPARWTSNWDEFVDANELADLLGNWGVGVDGGVVGTGVMIPEPIAFFMVGVGYLIHAIRRGNLNKVVLQHPDMAP